MRPSVKEIPGMLAVQTRVGAVVVAGAMAIGLAACGSSGTTVSTPNGSATISSSGSGGNSSVKIKTNKGTGEIQAGSKLPAGFPSAVPIPTFLKLSSSFGATSQGKSSYELIYSVSGSLTQAANRYDQQLRAAGFSASETATINGVIEQVWKSSAWTVQVQGSSGSGSSQSFSLDLFVLSSSPS
jgi:hypothetical protein